MCGMSGVQNVTGGSYGSRSSSTGLAFRRIGETGSERKSRAQVGSGYLRPGLVSVSVVLVIVVLTLDYRILDLSKKQKRVNPGNSDAGYGVLLHHEFGKGISERRNTECTRSVRGNRNNRKERESGCTYVSGMSGVQNARRRTGKMELLHIGSVFGR